MYKPLTGYVFNSSFSQAFTSVYLALFFTQIATLKDQLAQEMRKRQQYISRSVRTGDELRDIRNILDSSLGTVARDPSLDPILLDQEARRLDDTVDYHASKLAPSTRRRQHSPTRSTSPIRLGRATSTPLHSMSPPTSLRRTASPTPASIRKYRN